MKKLICMFLALILVSSCAMAAQNITVVSREDGSGTRSAFTELLDILDEDGDDATTDYAEITNSTAVMLATVAGNKNAIGYVSLGSLSDAVRAVRIDGTEASVENVVSGAYPVARPFNICTSAAPDALVQDFIAFIMSTDGQGIVSANSCIPAVFDAAPYHSANLSGAITIAGSTSVAPVMEKLAEAYIALNPGVSIEIQQSGSSAGIQSAIEGACDIGMASRDLKESEIESGLTSMVIARDGIAVIVNNENPVHDLSAAQIRAIFLGEAENWAEIAE